MEKIAAITPELMRTLIKLARRFEQSGFEPTAGQKIPLIGDAPRMYAAIVTEEIAAFSEPDVGAGKATIKYVPGVIGTDNELLDYPDSENPAEKTVHNYSDNVYTVGQKIWIAREFAGGRWFVVSGGGSSRRANAILDEDMTPSMAFVNVINVSGTTDLGGMDITEPLRVANGLKWYGIEGNQCKIEWNEFYDTGVEDAPLGGWELYAIEVNYTLECPTGQEEAME